MPVEQKHIVGVSESLRGEEPLTLLREVAGGPHVGVKNEASTQGFQEVVEQVEVLQGSFT